MADFMHCNSCYKQPCGRSDPKYFLTNCYHIICQSCREKVSSTMSCPICKHQMQVVEVNSAMDQKLQDLFKPPKKLLEEKILNMKRKYDFQQMLAKSLMGHLKKQREKMDQLMKYCQKQVQVSKENTKELEELKAWVRTAEAKLKENEEEKIRLMKEIEGLKKLDKGLNIDDCTGFESTINKIFGGFTNSTTDEASVASFSFSQGFETAESIPSTKLSFLHTSVSDADLNTSIASSVVSRPVLASPQSSVTSFLSEMTTPKMLGLPKRGVSNSASALHRTSNGRDNPYVEFIRSSGLRTTPTQYNTRSTVSSPSAPHPPSAPRSSARSPASRFSAQYVCGGSVTSGSVIPQVNSPATMLHRMQF